MHHTPNSCNVCCGGISLPQLRCARSGRRSILPFLRRATDSSCSCGERSASAPAHVIRRASCRAPAVWHVSPPGFGALSATNCHPLGVSVEGRAHSRRGRGVAVGNTNSLSWLLPMAAGSRCSLGRVVPAAGARDNGHTQHGDASGGFGRGLWVFA